MPPEPAPAMELHVREAGAGPPVVLLHGVGGDHAVWNAQLSALSPEFRAIAPDLRGHGGTPLPPGSTGSFPELLGDLRGLLRGRGIERAHLVGLSAGAFLALQWAVTHPGEVGSLVLSGGATHCDAHTRAVGRSWVEAHRLEGPDAFALRVMKDLFAPEWIEAHLDLVDRYREELAGRDFRGAALWGNAAESFDLRGRLGKLRSPTLILQGMDDRVVDSSHARLLRQTIPGAQFRLFPLTGHLVPVERPDECSEAILGWLRSHPLAEASGQVP